MDVEQNGQSTEEHRDLIHVGGPSHHTSHVVDDLVGHPRVYLMRLVEPGHLTPYAVLWSDQVVFTSHTVGSVGRSSTYEVSQADFVKDEAGEEE